MENRQWFSKRPDELYRELSSSPQGLTQKAARRRFRRGNGLLVQKKEGIFSIILGVLSDFSPVLLILFTVLAVALESDENAGTVITITALYLVASVLLSIRSQSIIESICGQRIPRVQVVREGRVFYVLSSNVVRGDIILLSEGDVVPADCRIIQSSGLFVHEGGVTGNAFSVPKSAETGDNYSPQKPEDMSNMLFALTKITHGTARAIAVDCGRDTFVFRTRGESKLPVSGRLKITAVLSQYARISGLVIPIVAFLLIVLDILIPPYSPIFSVFMWGFSLASSSSSQLFNLLGRAAVSSAVSSAAGRNSGAFVTDVSVLEKLKNIDTVIFSAESSVLTEECRVVSLYHNNSLHDPMFPDGEGGREMLGEAAAAIYALDSNLTLSGEGGSIPVLRAVINCAINQGADTSMYTRVESRSQGADSKFNTVLFVSPDGQYKSVSVSDASRILPYCSECIMGGVKCRMTPVIFSGASDIIASSEAVSRTVLAVAEKRTGYNNLRRIAAHQTEMTLIGFIIIEREISPRFSPTIRGILDTGIKPIMLTSERSNPETSANLALSLGIARKKEEIITGKEIAAMSDRNLASVIEGRRAVVCAGGDERTRIVYALEKSGHRTAYIGAETCDIGAVTASSAGFGCAYAGSRKNMEVLSRDTDRYGSQMIKIVSGVTVQRANRRGGGLSAFFSALLSAEGCFKNISGCVSYLISMQILRAVICLFGIFTGMPAVSSVQIIVSGMMLDLAAVMSFSAKRHMRIPRRMPSAWNYTDRVKKLAPYAASFAVFTYFIPFVAAKAGTMYEDSFSSVVFVTLLLTQIVLHAIFICEGSILNPAEWRGGLACGIYYASLLLLLFISILWKDFGAVFGIAPVSAADLLYSFIVPLAVIIAMEMTKYFRSRSPSGKNDGEEKEEEQTGKG